MLLLDVIKCCEDVFVLAVAILAAAVAATVVAAVAMTMDHQLECGCSQGERCLQIAGEIG